MEQQDVKKAVREKYASVAKGSRSCCGDTASLLEKVGTSVGYNSDELKSIPEESNLGLGCGNPLAHAEIQEGDTVLDLGSGAGIDCFLAAQSVGKSGKVIGVDMTHEMLEKARENSEKGGYDNVEFRLGEIENLPVADDSVDVVISNCVINLSTHKDRVFEEVFRVLKPGGKMLVSDIVLTDALPDEVRKSIDAYAGCIAGAEKRDDYIKTVEKAGLNDISIVSETHLPVDLWANDPIAEDFLSASGLSTEDIKKSLQAITSIKLRAVKP